MYVHLQKELTNCFPHGCKAVRATERSCCSAFQSAPHTLRAFVYVAIPVHVSRLFFSSLGKMQAILRHSLSPVLEPFGPPHSSGWGHPARGSPFSSEHAAHGKPKHFFGLPAPLNLLPAPPHIHMHTGAHTQAHISSITDCIRPGRRGQGLCYFWLYLLP